MLYRNSGRDEGFVHIEGIEDLGTFPRSKTIYLTNTLDDLDLSGAQLMKRSVQKAPEVAAVPLLGTRKSRISQQNLQKEDKN